MSCYKQAQTRASRAPRLMATASLTLTIALATVNANGQPAAPSGATVSGGAVGCDTEAECFLRHLQGLPCKHAKEGGS
jgi:hypothetical protein